MQGSSNGSSNGSLEGGSGLVGPTRTRQESLNRGPRIRINRQGANVAGVTTEAVQRHMGRMMSGTPTDSSCGSCGPFGLVYLLAVYTALPELMRIRGSTRVKITDNVILLVLVPCRRQVRSWTQPYLGLKHLCLHLDLLPACLASIYLSWTRLTG